MGDLETGTAVWDDGFFLRRGGVPRGMSPDITVMVSPVLACATAETESGGLGECQQNVGSFGNVPWRDRRPPTLLLADMLHATRAHDISALLCQRHWLELQECQTAVIPTGSSASYMISFGVHSSVCGDLQRKGGADQPMNVTVP